MPSEQYIKQKVLLPTEMDTAAYQSSLSTQVLERSFVMACVTNAKQLDKNKQMVSDILAGKLSPASAREELRQYYDETGYTAKQGEEGTIKDLSTPKRMQATIDTNVAMARGYTRKRQLAGNPARPGLELYRQGQAIAPRNWTVRWASAYAEVGGEGASAERMIALHESPIWAALSAFGTDYPPFDWGSHMRVKSVDYDTCESLGLVPKLGTKKQEAQDEISPQKASNRPYKTFNDGASYPCELIDPKVEQDLVAATKGYARVKNGQVIPIDLDGSSPKTAADLLEDWESSAAVGRESVQKKALERWINDNTIFNPNYKGLGAASLEQQAQIRVLLQRLQPITSATYGQSLYRGLTFKNKHDRDQFLKTNSEVYSPRADRVGESATVDQSKAISFASKKQTGVVIVYEEYHTAKRIDNLYKGLKIPYKNAQHPEITEGESLFLPSSKFKITQRKEGEDGIIYLYASEVL